MKTISISAAICALALTAISSSAGEDPETKPWREIASGTQSNIEEATRQVIQTPEAWVKWWNSHNPDAPEPPKVDFEKETVLVATLGMRSSGGHAISFSGIRREGEKITAALETSSPGPGDMVTMALTYPFAVIAIPKHQGPVNFVVE